MVKMVKVNNYDAILVCNENYLNPEIRQAIINKVCLLSEEYKCPVVFPSSIGTISKHKPYSIIRRSYLWYVLSGNYYIKYIKDMTDFKSFLLIADPKEIKNHLLDLKNNGFEAVVYDKLEELYASKVL